jgi:hypothetical protein
MNIEKIKIRNNCYVWVDKDAEIEEAVWYYWCTTKTIQKSIKDSLNRLPKKEDGSFKILAASPELEIESIPDYVYWLAEQWIDENEHRWSNNTNELGNNYGSFIKGYRTAEQEMFTEDDMKRAILQARIRDKENPPHPKYSIESIIEQIKLKNNEEF